MKTERALNSWYEFLEGLLGRNVGDWEGESVRSMIWKLDIRLEVMRVR